MSATRPIALACLLLLAAPASQAQTPERLPATLAGHAVLPAASVMEPPRDAPEAVATSGKFTGPDGARVEAVGSIPGRSGSGPGARPTGIDLPLPGQPLQGVSALRAAGDGTFWALTDNGFGSKANSADALLTLNRLRIDWATGAVTLVETVWLSDPRKILPFPATLEGTERRYLTGADLDPESLVVDAGGFWIGDEFGPWLLRFDRQGALGQVVPARLGGRVLRSPDNPAVRMPGTPAPAENGLPFEVTRSRGFEGLAGSVDGGRLYAMLEGPVWQEGKAETFADGKPRLRLLEFDTARGDWTGQSWTYQLEAEGHAIGEITRLDADRFLVIERDGGEGDAAQACPAGAPAPTCFVRPAKFKRLYLVSKAGLPDGGALVKQGFVDLLEIADPNGVARQGVAPRGGTARNRFAMPFVTIESVEPTGDGRLVVVNDNNLPFSAGRLLDRADDTEFVLLEVPGLVRK